MVIIAQVIKGDTNIPLFLENDADHVATVLCAIQLGAKLKQRSSFHHKERSSLHNSRMMQHDEQECSFEQCAYPPHFGMMQKIYQELPSAGPSDPGVSFPHLGMMQKIYQELPSAGPEMMKKMSILGMMKKMSQVL
jgi:hypothetical protein